MGIKASVSLYSLQYQYLQGKMNLEEIIAFVKSLGSDGIELLPDQMLHGTPEPTEETYQMWNALVKKYGIGLACDDVFLNTNMFKNRELTKEAALDAERPHVVLCQISDGGNLGTALRACLGFGVKKTDEYIEEMLRLDSPYVGIVPDTSLYMKRAPRVMTNYIAAVMGNLNPDIIKYTDEVFASGTDFFQLNLKSKDGMDPKLRSLIKSPADGFYAANISGYENRRLEELDSLAKYIKHVHFKLYEMTDEGDEYSIDYKEILQYLHDHGYNGYVSTEYEGNRWVLPDHEIPEVQQVTAHQKMIQRYIKEIEG